MSLHVSNGLFAMNSLLKTCKTLFASNTSCRSLRLRKCFYGIYEPDYLEKLKPTVPEYDKVNVQLKGYDFTVLENFQKFLVKAFNNMDIDVENSWAMPAETTKIVRYKPRSVIVDSEFTLNLYERVVQVSELPCSLYPQLVRVIEASQPEGVTVNIFEHEPIHENNRYIPDYELNELKVQLEEMLPGSAAKKK